VSKTISKEVEYFYDSARLVGYFCADESAATPRPGVVIVHDACGVSEHMKRTAESLADLGFAVLAADVWGDGQQLRDESAVGPMIGRFASDRKTWMGRLEAAKQALVAESEVEPSKIAMVGYCFGGASALEYARTVGGVAGVVSVHGGLELVGGDWTTAPPNGKALILTGFEDPMAKSSVLLDLENNMTRAGVDWQVNTYGHTKHGFTRPDSDRANKPQVIAYNEQSAKRSWAAMRGFLHEIFAL